MSSILTIDDDPLFCRVLGSVFSAAGYETFEALDGKKGEAIFREVHPDLTIIDVWMPERDGLETVRSLRQIDPAAKLIIMSGRPTYAGMPVFEVAALLGATEAIQKPFTPEEILATVHRVLAA